MDGECLLKGSHRWRLVSHDSRGKRFVLGGEPVLLRGGDGLRIAVEAGIHGEFLCPDIKDSSTLRAANDEFACCWPVRHLSGLQPNGGAVGTAQQRRDGVLNAFARSAPSLGAAGAAEDAFDSRKVEGCQRKVEDVDANIAEGAATGQFRVNKPAARRA